MMELITNPWVTYTGIALIALLLGVYVGNINGETDHDEIEELAYEKSTLKMEISNLENQKKELENRMYGMREELINVVNDIDNAKIGVTLTKVHTDALDLYDRAGIKIPVDIIEDLAYNNDMKTVTEAKHYIESQRNNWKLENSKKI